MQPILLPKPKPKPRLRKILGRVYVKPQKYPRYRGKILSLPPEPNPEADARQKSLVELLKRSSRDWDLYPLSPEEVTEYIKAEGRLTGISDSAISKSQEKLLLSQKADEKRYEDKQALIGPINHLLAARKAQAAAAAAASHVLSEEKVVKAKIERRLEADITVYITKKYGEKAETILGKFFDKVNFDDAYNSGRLTPSDNYLKIATHWINEIERRITSDELLGDGGGGGAAAMFETNEDEEGPLQRNFDGGKKSKKVRRSKKARHPKKSKKSRKMRHSKRSKTRKHL
jgi:hypothetical protein